MTTRFSEQRHSIADALAPILEVIQTGLDSADETDVDAYDLLLETVVKLGLVRQGRGPVAAALGEYRDLVAGDLLSAALSTDEMPELE